MEKQILQIEKEDAQDLVWGDYDETIYEVISNKIVSKSRWSYRSELIIKTLADGKFWKSFYSQGATESQDESPYEYGDVKFLEVFPKQIEVTIYE
jgi:hypothetical protein